jgi:hypothetical protein
MRTLATPGLELCAVRSRIFQEIRVADFAQVLRENVLGSAFLLLGKTSVGRVGHNDQFWGLDLGDGCGSLVVTIGASAKLSDRCKAWRLKGPFILGTFVYARPASHSSACFFSCWSLRDNWTA